MGASLIFGIGGLCRFIEDEVEVLEGVVGGLKRERRFPYVCVLVGMLGPKLKLFCLAESVFCMLSLPLLIIDEDYGSCCNSPRQKSVE